jgi:hypothetical protein
MHQRVPAWSKSAVWLLFLVALYLPLAGYFQGQPTVFEPGMRWSHDPSPSRPWIPHALDLGCNGQLVWSAPGVANPHRALLSAPGRTAQRLIFTDRELGDSSGSFDVLASSNGELLFGLAQFPSPDVFHRRTVISRYDALAASHGASHDPVWSHAMPPLVNAPARLAGSEDGTVVVAAVYDAAAMQLTVDWLDGVSGSLMRREVVPAQALRALATDRSAALVAVSAGLSFYVFETSGGLLHQESLASATEALALSPDGLALALGGGGFVRLLDRGAASYVERFRVHGQGGELAMRADVSLAGRTLAVGWWNAVDAVSTRFELWDGQSQARAFELAQPGVAGGLQSFPQSVLVNPEGNRAAFGSWGLGGAEPELVLYDCDAAETLLSIDLPGSLLDLAMDSQGERLAVGMKAAHANLFASTGEIRLYDTGQCELALIGQPEVGGTLHVAAKRPGARQVLFLLGTPATEPSTLGNMQGNLLLDRGASLMSHSRPANAAGRADLLLDLDGNPLPIGQGLAIQPAFRLQSGWILSERLLLPVIL